MEKAAIFHRPTDNFAYLLDETNVTNPTQNKEKGCKDC